MSGFVGCEHNLNRTIHHEPSQIRLHELIVGNAPAETGISLAHSPGDRIVLVCPHGCEDIVVTVVPNPPDGLYDDE